MFDMTTKTQLIGLNKLQIAQYHSRSKEPYSILLAKIRVKINSRLEGATVYREPLISRSVWTFVVAVARWQHRRGGKARAVESFYI